MLFNVAGGLSPSLTNMINQRGKLNNVYYNYFLLLGWSALVERAEHVLYGGEVPVNC
jgi:hypothetical protein